MRDLNGDCQGLNEQIKIKVTTKRTFDALLKAFWKSILVISGSESLFVEFLGIWFGLKEFVLNSVLLFSLSSSVSA